MKKIPYKLPFKINFFKEQDPFHLVIIFFIIFFGTAIFFSIPTFYDYKKYNKQIESVINKEFKINLYNLEDISFRFIPSPHLLINKAEVKIRNNEENSIAELNKIKIFISILDFYRDDRFKIKEMKINKANLYLNATSLKNLITNLKKNIVNKLSISKSTIFFKDSEDEIILISKIKNINYFIDYVASKKILKVEGNLFDSNYEFKYMIDYKSPHTQHVNIELKNPNIFIENKLTDKLEQSIKNQDGSLVFKFLNKVNTINYNIEKNKINFISENLKNSNFDLSGAVNFHPFHFDLIFSLNKINLKQLENIFYTVYKNKNPKLENLSGKLKLNFKDIDNKAIKDGSFDVLFENSNTHIDNAIFRINDIADLEISSYEYLNNPDQILESQIKIKIKDQERFNRFLFNYKKNKILSKNLFFTYQYNLDKQESYISPISTKGFERKNEFYKFNNLQQLKILAKDSNVFKVD